MRNRQLLLSKALICAVVGVLTNYSGLPFDGDANLDVKGGPVRG